MADRPYETRTVTADIELRDDEGGDAAPVLTGYASTFNEPYQVGFFREQIHPDAFKRTLSNSPDVRLLIDHEGQPLARTKSGTLQLTSDGTGLAVRATLDPSDPDVQRLLPKMRRGDLDQMSFAFRVPVDGDVWDYSGDTPSRTIREANLSGGDVSVVTYPANDATTAQVRARDEAESAFTLASSMLAEARSGRQFDVTNTERLRTAMTLLGFELNATLKLDDEARKAAPTPEPTGTSLRLLISHSDDAVQPRAAADMSYSDRESALSDALLAKYAASDDDDDAECDMWVVDAADTWVVWRQWGDTDPGIGLWRLNYTLDDAGAVTFTGDPVKVTAQTSYEPAAGRSAGTSIDFARRASERLALRAQRA